MKDYEKKKKIYNKQYLLDFHLKKFKIKILLVKLSKHVKPKRSECFILSYFLSQKTYFNRINHTNKKLLSWWEKGFLSFIKC